MRSVKGAEIHTLSTLKSLGLGRIGKVRIHSATPSTLGMIKAVEHLVEVELAGE